MAVVAAAVATGKSTVDALISANLVGDSLHIGILFNAFFNPGSAPKQNGISVDRRLIAAQLRTDDDASDLLRCWASRDKAASLNHCARYKKFDILAATGECGQVLTFLISANFQTNPPVCRADSTWSSSRSLQDMNLLPSTYHTQLPTCFKTNWNQISQCDTS